MPVFKGRCEQVSVSSLYQQHAVRAVVEPCRRASSYQAQLAEFKRQSFGDIRQQRPEQGQLLSGSYPNGLGMCVPYGLSREELSSDAMDDMRMDYGVFSSAMHEASRAKGVAEECRHEGSDQGAEVEPVFNRVVSKPAKHAWWGESGQHIQPRYAFTPNNR